MFRKRKEQKEREHLISLIEDAILECRKKVMQHAVDVSEELSQGRFVWDKVWRIENMAFSWHDRKYLTNDELRDKYNEILELDKKTNAEVDAYWERATENKEKMEKMFSDGVPLFITITSMHNKDYKLYSLCYEFKKVKDGDYKAYVFTNERESGYVEEISYLDYSIEKMTEEEFENHYIIGRCELFHASDETEGIEYDNRLRRLFNGQRN